MKFVTILELFIIYTYPPTSYSVDSQLNYPPFQIAIYWRSQYTSTPTWSEGGGGRAGSHEVEGNGYVFTNTSQVASIGAIFASKNHTKQLNPCPNSSPSHVVNYSWLSACQGDMEPFEGHPSTRGYLTSLRYNIIQSKISLGIFQHQYLAELLVNVQSYRLTVKSVSCCCVRGRRLFSKVSYISMKLHISVHFVHSQLAKPDFLTLGDTCTAISRYNINNIFSYTTYSYRQLGSYRIT